MIVSRCVSLLGLLLCRLLYGMTAHPHQTTISLSSSLWTVTNSNGSIKVGAVVPGSVYTDLMRAGLLQDPYYRFNDVAYRWLAYDNWTYTASFQVNEDLLSKDVIDLVAEGVDTIATVYINKRSVGQTSNMFRRYVWNIKAFLQDGWNTIDVAFVSPVLYAASKARGYPYTVPPQCPVPAQHGECHFNFIRKAACSFSWDWGPAFPSMGIWKDLLLDGYSQVSLRYITAETSGTHSHGVWQWLLVVEAVFAVHKDTKQPTGGGKQGPVDVVIYLPALNLHQKRTFFVTQDEPRAQIALTIPHNVSVALWWPNGAGRQVLYDVVTTYRTQLGSEQGSRTIRVGFRTVELVQQPLPQSTGLSFYFKINNKPLFMKGSNWIPADAFQERVTPQYVRQLLTSAKEANMNVLRVWGGGAYESSVFYSIADELGIMVWQDMMFACAMYPSDNDFLHNVQQEVLHQVLRLKHHASIVLWSGNNENEWGLAPYKSLPVYKRYYKDYLSLYKTTIAAVIAAEDPRRPFVPSSPSNGLDTYREGWVASNPQSNLYGDIHHYDYKSDSWNWKNFPVPRFASEYGLQSWCSLETLQNVTLPQDRTTSSNFTNHRQHHPNGNEELLQELQLHFNLSSLTRYSSTNFADFIFLTQINQAMGMKTETERYRRGQGIISNGTGWTMGALYWQLNDIWQAPTWASIEYGGKWKMLHYYAKSFFAQSVLSPYTDGDRLHVYYINEEDHTYSHSEKLRSHKNLADISALDDDTSSLNIKCYSWNSLQPLKIWIIPFTKNDRVSSEIYEASVAQLLQEAGCPGHKYCFLYFSLSHKENTKPSNWLLLSNMTEVQGLKPAHLQVSHIRKTEAKQVELTLSTDAVALFVWLEMAGIPGRFSDNGFLMVQKRRQLTFTSWQALPVDYEHALSVKSLM